MCTDRALLRPGCTIVTWGDSSAEKPGLRLRQDRPGLLTVIVDPIDTLDAEAMRTLRTLAKVGRELRGDIRVVVVTLIGPTTRPGQPGPVVAELGALGEDECDRVLAETQAGLGWLRRPDLVSVAVLTGVVAGIGVQLALGCDLRLLSEEASLVFTETVGGLVPALTGTGPLVDLIGVARATEFYLTGRAITAAQADRLGLASRVLPEAELAAASAALVGTLLAVDRRAAAETKALFAGAAGRGRGEQEAAERSALARLARDRTGRGD